MPEPTIPAGLADHDILLVGVGHRTDRRAALGTYHAQLTRREAQQGVALITADQLRISAGSASDLAAFPRLHLDVVDNRSDRHAPHRHRIARLDVDPLAGHHGVPSLESLRRQNIGELSILVADQRDKRGTVRVVFEPLHGRRHIEFGALEIDYPIALLGAPAAPSHRDAASVVATSLGPQTFG